MLTERALLICIGAVTCGAMSGVAFFLGGMLERHKLREAEKEARIKAATDRVRTDRLQSRPEWIRSTQPQPGTAGFAIAAAMNGRGCLGRSAADEPVFVLCARDKAASMIVRDWARLAEKLGAKPAKTAEAEELAERMEAWRERHGGGKVPD